MLTVPHADHEGLLEFMHVGIRATKLGHGLNSFLSIWSTQTYKHFVRSQMTDVPGGKVDRLLYLLTWQMLLAHV